MSNVVKNNLHQHLDVLFGDKYAKAAFHGFHYEGLHQRLLRSAETGNNVNTPRVFEFRNPNMAASVATLSTIGAIEIQSHRQVINSPVNSNKYLNTVATSSSTTTATGYHHMDSMPTNFAPIAAPVMGSSSFAADMGMIGSSSSSAYTYQQSATSWQGGYEDLHNQRQASFTASTTNTTAIPTPSTSFYPVEDDIPDSAFLDIDIDSKLCFEQ